MRGLFVTLLMMAGLAQAKPIVIAVIDTGIEARNPHLCKFGHESYVPKGILNLSKQDPLVDDNGHGTNVAGLIAKFAGDGDYCIVSLQYFHYGLDNLNRERNAFRHAIDLKVDFINLSGGGPDPDPQEEALVKEALNNGIKVVVAAGNDGQNLQNACYYPACYDPRIVVVGNLRADEPYKCGDDVLKPNSNPALPTSYKVTASSTSNHGLQVNRWEIGQHCPTPNRDAPMSGTSQAAAIATGKLVRVELKRRAALRR